MSGGGYTDTEDVRQRGTRKWSRKNNSTQVKGRSEKVENKPKKPEPVYDPIFFRKIDLKVGVKLLYKGRLQPNTFWKIVRIRSDQGVGKGLKSVNVVQKISDYLTVQNSDGETREMSFSYASYSAIWQLPREA